MVALKIVNLSKSNCQAMLYPLPKQFASIPILEQRVGH